MIGSSRPWRAAFAGLLFLVASRASAHGLNVSVEPGSPGGIVTVVAYFDDDTPAEDAKVIVSKSDGAVLRRGVTDERGMWTFARPPAGRYRILVDAGSGHRKHANLDIPADAEADARLDTPSRANFTRFPWLTLSGGVGGLGVIAGGAWLLRRSRRSSKTTSEAATS